MEEVFLGSSVDEIDTGSLLDAQRQYQAIARLVTIFITENGPGRERLNVNYRPQKCY